MLRSTFSHRAVGPRRLRIEALEARMVLEGGPIISEILASNDDGLTDTDGDASDWIEIHQPGAEPVDLANWYLTDDPDFLTKWQFPATTIQTGGRLVAFASDKNRRVAGLQLHTNFKLDAAGDFLALVQPDGVTIASQFAPRYPEQFEDISYGIGRVETVTTLVGPDAAASFLVPDTTFDTQHGGTWTGGSEPFDDSTAAGWTSGELGLGYDASREIRPPGIDGTIAYQTQRGSPGDQALSGSLGMDFIVTRPIVVTLLGAFDDSSDGMRRTITVQLWSRDDRGTSGNFADDLGIQPVASDTFIRTNTGALVGGSRFKALPEPLLLAPGAYTIVASGYGSTERHGTAATGGAGYGLLGNSDAIEYVGKSRFNTGTTSGFPRFLDPGPANRYGAGTFTYFDPAVPIGETGGAPAGDRSLVALKTTPGVGEANFGGVLGMDFQVSRPIRVTELGIFDSGQNGITGTLAVSLWQRSNNTGTLLADRTFMGTAGQIAPGTGSRFLALDEPLMLMPGQYTVVASGFYGDDTFSSYDSSDPHHGTIDSGDGSITFVNASRWAFDPALFNNRVSNPFRAFNLPFHTFPDRPDSGPANKYAAGTFRFEPLIDSLLDGDASSAFNVSGSVFVRVPFDVAADASFSQLRLKAHYDDGMVVYLNGTEVARRNAPATLAYNSNAAGGRPSVDTFIEETIDLTAHVGLLHPGRNVLAIHGLNASASDLDFLVSPRLEAVTALPPAERFFSTPTPGAANGTGVLGRVFDTTFDRDRGFVEPADLNEQGELVVQIATRTPDANIYYTTDGSVPSPTNGIPYTDAVRLTRTTTLRARAFKDGYLSTDADTQTYIFLDDVLDVAGTPTGLPTHWNGVTADYAMSQNPDDLAAIVGGEDLTEDEIHDAIKTSLRGLPTMSVVLDPEDLFGPAQGLYSNPFGRADAWERPASIEYILPDGTPGFQIDAGLRMQGWTSRIPTVTPKHSLKISFREEYGDGRLNYPFFPDSPITSFDTISLRSNNRDSWISDYRVLNNNQIQFMRPQSTYIRDEWSKDTLRDLGQPSPHGNFVHLYLNGVYWGVYNPTERPDADFAQSYLGGDEADYDVMRFCNPAPEIVDGQRNMWDALLAAKNAGFTTLEAYQRVQGLNADGTRNLAFNNLLDVDSLIDFMILGHFHAGDDWPCNFYAIRDRGPDSAGFKFTEWDDDLALAFADAAASTVEPGAFCFNVPANQLPGCLQLYGRTPGSIDAALRANPEYRLRFADHVQRHLFNGGALTPERNIERWLTAAQEVSSGLIAEAVRWGDYRLDVASVGDPHLYTPGDEWASSIDLMASSFFPARSDVVIDQWRAVGLFPNLDAPQFSQRGGQAIAGATVELSAATETIYYTLDGSDPRAIGGAVSLTAIEYIGPIVLDRTRTVKARVFDGTDWSALDEALFSVDTPLRVTELFFNPPGADEDTEFIELRNIGAEPLDLAGVHFTRDAFGAGITYEFLPTDANLTLGPGQYLVVTQNPAAFATAFPLVPAERIASRDFAGNLGNGGDTITLLDRFDGVIQQFTYDDAWHPDADGDGRSLVILDSSGDRELWNQAAGWRASLADGGSPGEDDVLPGDMNGDQQIGVLDLVRLMAFVASPPGFGSSAVADVNRDGSVDRGDIAALVSSLGRSYAPSTLNSTPPPADDIAAGAPPLWKPLAASEYSPFVIASAAPRVNWITQSIVSMTPFDTGYQPAPAEGTPPMAFLGDANEIVDPAAGGEANDIEGHEAAMLSSENVIADPTLNDDMPAPVVTITALTAPGLVDDNATLIAPPAKSCEQPSAAEILVYYAVRRAKAVDAVLLHELLG